MDRFCKNCGQPLVPDSQFCPECGQAVTAVDAQEPAFQGDDDALRNDQAAIYWSAEYPLVTSRFFLRDVGKLLFFTYLVMAVMLALMMMASGESPAETLPLLPYFALVVGGLGVMILLISLMVLGNRAGAIYRMDDRGLAMVARSKALPLHELSQWLGALTGDGQLWASGVLAKAQEKVYIRWSSVHGVRDYPADHVRNPRSTMWDLWWC